MTKERNPVWRPIPSPKPLWANVAEIITAYQDAAPVKVSKSQRYSLVVTELKEQGK